MGSKSTTQRRTVLREALWPPWFEGPRTTADLRWFTRIRLFLIAASLAVDLGLLVWLYDAPGIERSVLVRFAAINASVLVFDALVSVVALRRRHAAAEILELVLVSMEMFTIAVWLQVTGTVSSYFIATCFVLPLGYRIVGNYRIGLVAYASMMVFHVGAFGFEELGLLEPMSLFEGESTSHYNTPRYRILVMWTLASCYMPAFGLVNLFVKRRRQREAELQDMREKLAHVAEGLRYGRLSGRVIANGEIELAEVLGRGGMGEVYRGRHRDHGECAVKVIHPHLAHRDDMIARFRAEAEAAASLPDHVSPALLGADFERAERFIAMEYLRGEDLAAYLRRRGRVSAQEAVDIVGQLAVKLDAAHDAGLVHRDLKPHNVFLVAQSDAALELRILDFGIAKLIEAESKLTRTGVILGSPGYMAPEQARGDSAKVGPAADTFALGAICYELLTGHRAFPTRDSVDAVAEVLGRTPPAATARCPDLPPGVDLVLRVALAKDAQLRFQRASELADAIAEAIRGTVGDDIVTRAERLGDPAEPELVDSGATLTDVD